MKLTILQNKLKQGLGYVEKVSIKSPTLPILSNVLLEAKSNFLKLSATNLEMGIHYWILAKVEKEGKIPVLANVFTNFINYLPQSSLLIEKQQNDLEVSYQGTKSKIRGLNPEDFPIIPKVEKEEKVSIRSSILCQGLSQIINIASFSTIRPEISGIYFLFQKNLLTLAATDSFRLGEKKIFFKTSLDISSEYSFILPQKAALFLVSVLGERDEDIFLYFSPNLVMFEVLMEEIGHPRIQFVSKLIEGEYPKYKEIIPEKSKAETVFNRKEFLTQIKTAGLFAGRINEVKLGFDPEAQKVKISCQDPELGEHSSEIAAQVKGEKSEISFNYKFLLDGLQGIKTEDVVFALSEARSNEEGPGVLKPVNDETYLYVVMPIQAS